MMKVLTAAGVLASVLSLAFGPLKGCLGVSSESGGEPGGPHARVRGGTDEPKPNPDTAGEKKADDAKRPVANPPVPQAVPSDPPKPASVQPAAPLSAAQIREAARDGTREALDPLMKQYKEVTSRTRALEEKVDRLEADGTAVQSDSARTLAEFRAELAGVRAAVQKLAAALDAAKAPKPVPEVNPEIEQLKADDAKLQKKVDELASKVPEPVKPPEPKPEPRPGAWNTKPVTLPCGYYFGVVNLPAGGVYIDCPKCGRRNFVP